MTSSPDTLILIHRIVGYPTAFIIAPLALLAFAKASVHRPWGKAYFYLLLFLYLTGTWLTLTQHPWNTWSFARNVTFNFFGFSMVLYGYRAIWLFRRPEPRRERLDWFLAGLLTTSVVALLSVAIWKDTPMRIFTLIGIWLCVLEYRELRQGFTDKALLYRRHQRYILASYFYVLTVVSIVHLHDELPRNLKWLWPSLVGMLVIWLLTGRKRTPGEVVPQSAEPSPRQSIIPTLPCPRMPRRWVVLATVALALLYGVYVVYDLISGAAISTQNGMHP